MAFAVSEAQSFKLSNADRGRLRSALIALAWHIARNREIAGLHYPSDSRAGERLATGAFAILNNPSPAVMPVPNGWARSRFREAVWRARLEWN